MSKYRPPGSREYIDSIVHDSRPGSSWFEKREEATQQMIKRQEEATTAKPKPKPTRAERLKADPDAWENMAEAWELEEPEQFECCACGRKGDQTEIKESTRRCGTGLGEWYCVRGQGCQAKT